LETYCVPDEISQENVREVAEIAEVNPENDELVKVSVPKLVLYQSPSRLLGYEHAPRQLVAMLSNNISSNAGHIMIL